MKYNLGNYFVETPRLFGVFAALIFVVQSASTSEAQATVVGKPAASTGLVVATLEVGEAKVLPLQGLANKIFVGDPKIADARPNNGTSLVLVATAVGSTTLIASNDDGDIMGKYCIIVTPAGGITRQAESAIHRAGDGSVHISRTGNGALLTGEVQTPLDADDAFNTAVAGLPQGSVVTNNLKIRDSVQVNLRVRIVEMSRTLTRALGVNWKNLGGDLGSVAKLGLTTMSSMGDLAGGASIAAGIKNTSIEAVIDAMSQEQIIRTLAQPNLTTVSGQAANFLVGGEFPIPISSSMGQVSVQFKTYGISLTFLPTVLSSGQINLKVRPEVSYLTDQGAVTFATDSGKNMTIPALNVRRAETTVQLGSGESFAIAGLMRDVATSNNSMTPFLGEVPVLGALFRSDNFKHEQTELVIIVTPYIVKPVSNAKAFHTPDENYGGADEADKFLTFNWKKAASSSVSKRPNTAVAPVQGTVAAGVIQGRQDVSSVYQAQGAAPLRAPAPVQETLDDPRDDIEGLTPSLSMRPKAVLTARSSRRIPSDLNYNE